MVSSMKVARVSSVMTNAFDTTKTPINTAEYTSMNTARQAITF
jgi:hypothetical protein